MTDEELTTLVSSISKKVFGKEFTHTASFNNKLRTTGGRYMLKSHRIEINPRVLEIYGEDELTGVIKHELCHYHLHLEGKGYKHRDRDFRELLKKTNSPRFCSNLVEKKTTTRPYKYQYICTKCGLLYNRKIRINTQKYRCGKCLGELILHSTKKIK